MRNSLIGLTMVSLCALLIGGANSAAAAQAGSKRAAATKPAAADAATDSAAPAASKRAPAADPAAPTPAPAVTWDELSQAIRTIESATKPDEASAAYALGCNVNRSSIKLQDTYMKKQLKLGRPDLASIPAQQLTTLDPKNGIAWGDLSYVVVKRGPTGYLLALTDGLKAIDLDPENPGICQDVAQLVAWYGANKAKLAALDPDSAAILKKLMDGSLSQEYTKDAKDAKDAYSQFDKDRAVRKKEADAADAEVKKLDAKFKQLGETYKAKGKAYDTAVQKISTIQDQLSHSSQNIAGSTSYSQRDSQITNQRNLQNQLRDARNAADKAQADQSDTEKQGEQVKKELDTKRAAAAKLQKALGSTDELPATFAWVPPAVDGVITPDALAAAAKARGAGTPAPDAATPAAESGLTARAAEAEAGDMLDRAKLGADSKDDGMRTMAKNLLAEILRTYPNTKAATEAKALAAKMQ